MENSWFLGFLFALIIIPLIVVELFLPIWFSAVQAAGARTVYSHSGAKHTDF